MELTNAALTSLFDKYYEQGQLFAYNLIKDGFNIDRVGQIIQSFPGESSGLLLAFEDGVLHHLEKVLSRMHRDMDNIEFFNKCRIR